MKNGFTLIEMIAIVLIISLIVVITVPMISNQLANNKSKISNTTKDLIYNAVELYMNEKEINYPKLSGNKYCVSLDEVVKSGLLQYPIKDYNTNSEIPLTKYIRVTVNNNSEYDNFELLDNC